MPPISQTKLDALHERMEELGIKEEDLQESFVRSQGSGGQNVNKVATCVVLLHEPSGTSVKCQRTRSQSLNRYYARQLLTDKIDREQRGKESAEAARIAKIRRQKKRRSRRAKEKILQDKRTRSELKAKRRRVLPEND